MALADDALHGRWIVTVRLDPPRRAAFSPAPGSPVVKGLLPERRPCRSRPRIEVGRHRP
jgi:hypothetical protein